MDPIQILLIIILTVSTFFVSIIGVQLFITLRELRKTLRNANKVIEGFESMGVGLTQGFQEAVGFMNGFRVILRAINVISQSKHEKK